MAFSHLSIDQFAQWHQEDVDSFLLVDIRDAQSYANGHIENAIHIDNSNVEDFLRNSDHSKKIVVCCYHGNSSQGAADYFNQQGFSEAFSLEGGFDAWRQANI
jgi:thiosulfate sulfurtransferase